MPAEERPHRAELLAVAATVAASIDDPPDGPVSEAARRQLDVITRHTDVGLASECDAAFALGWLHPALAHGALESATGDTARALLVAVLLGLSQRCNDVTAGALVDDPRGTEPVHQMLGARLADNTALGSALEVTLDHLVDARVAGSAMAATLALSYEVALAACATAQLAAVTVRTRGRLEDRHRWLVERASDANPLELLDEVAYALDLERAS